MTEPRPAGIAGFNATAEQALARIEQWSRAANEKADRYEAAAKEADQLRVTATSRAAEVRVTVRADGTIDAIDFTSKARSVPLPELASMVLSTMREAQSRIAGQVGEVLVAEIGEADRQTTASMVNELRTRFPAPEPGRLDAPTSSPPPAPPAESPPDLPPQPPRRQAAPPSRRRPRDDEPADGDNLPW